MDKLEQFKTILKVYAKVIDDGLANKEHFKDECEGETVRLDVHSVGDQS